MNKELYITDSINQHLFKKQINADNATVVVLSDIHYGANNEQYFDEVLDFLKRINAYIIIGGDAINGVTANSKGKLQDEWIQDKDEQITQLAEKLKPFVQDGKILAIGEEGNHASRATDSVYISPNKVLAVLLGDKNLYTGSMCLGMINVNKVCYTISIMHNSRKQRDYYEYLRSDITIHEHLHSMHYEKRAVLSWNKIAKAVSVIPVYDVWNGSFINIPEYSKKANYRPTFMGSYCFRLSGKKRDIQIFEDVQLHHLVDNGYLGLEV